jgi:hypothetical protein
MQPGTSASTPTPTCATSRLVQVLAADKKPTSVYLMGRDYSLDGPWPVKNERQIATMRRTSPSWDELHPLGRVKPPTP